jgi:hypothetical protein
LAAAREDFGNGSVAGANLNHGALANVAKGLHNGVASSVIN